MRRSHCCHPVDVGCERRAQNNVSRSQLRVIDPVELAGPPKKPPVISPAMRALADSSVMKVDAKDLKAAAGAVRELTALLDRFPNEPGG